MSAANSATGAFRGCAVVLAVLVTSVVPRIAGAQGQSFRDLVQQASEAYAARDADRAIQALERAYRIRAVPALLYNLARAHQLAGRLATAVDLYDRFLETAPPEDQARAARDGRDAARAELEARRRAGTAPNAAGGGGASTGSGTASSGGGAANGGGGATSSATANGASAASTNANANATAAAQLGTGGGLRDDPRATLPRSRVFGPGHIALMAGGGAMLAGGVVFGVMALSAAGEFSSTYDPAARAALQDRGAWTSWGANLGIGLGVAMVGVGVVWYLAQPLAPRTPASRVTLVAPGILVF